MLLVVVLTAAMMVIEIAAGYLTNSMALLADGWHMATHVGALGLASAAYAFSRRYAAHPAFAFGTGKVHALAGYTSAAALAVVALFMLGECAGRLVRPRIIDFGASLPVAALGLVVNLASVIVLHAHDDGEHDHGHDHDHNHRAAFLHVLADTFTSALAIAAILAGRFAGWTWLDAVIGIVGGLVILQWAARLARDASLQLLDVSPSAALESGVREALESVEDVRVIDLHVWSPGASAKSCVATLVSATPREPEFYRRPLERFALSHVTIEVRRGAGEHAELVENSRSKLDA